MSPYPFVAYLNRPMISSAHPLYVSNPSGHVSHNARLRAWLARRRQRDEGGQNPAVVTATQNGTSMKRSIVALSRRRRNRRPVEPGHVSRLAHACAGASADVRDRPQRRGPCNACARAPSGDHHALTSMPRRVETRPWAWSVTARGPWNVHDMSMVVRKGLVHHAALDPLA